MPNECKKLRHREEELEKLKKEIGELPDEPWELGTILDNTITFSPVFNIIKDQFFPNDKYLPIKNYTYDEARDHFKIWLSYYKTQLPEADEGRLNELANYLRIFYNIYAIVGAYGQNTKGAHEHEVTNTAPYIDREMLESISRELFQYPEMAKHHATTYWDTFMAQFDIHEPGAHTAPLPGHGELAATEKAAEAKVRRAHRIIERKKQREQQRAGAQASAEERPDANNPKQGTKRKRSEGRDTPNTHLNMPSDASAFYDLSDVNLSEQELLEGIEEFLNGPKI